MTNDQLRDLPSIDRLLNLPEVEELIAVYGRSLTTQALRQTLADARAAILANQPFPSNFPQQAAQWLQNLLEPTLKPVINGTGVIIHTNLGRAPLSKEALAAIQSVGSSYSTLEYSLVSGKRGSRAVHAENLLTRITATEAALVVNNNASAILLMLNALCQKKEVIISRGQLVEIGGGFRIPDVMAQSGAHLVEVGTTNRTHLRDYANAINENTAAILVAHASNYKIIGFTTEPSLSELAELAHKHNIPLLYDQGSGALLDTAQFGLDPEPSVPDGLNAGCDLVLFSGDKLLGGPQAGIICGKETLVNQLKRHPLARAVRADKLCLAALSATLTHYLADQHLTNVPIWRMIARPLSEIKTDAAAWASHLQENGIEAGVINGRSTVGGGSLPGTSLPTWLLAITHPDIEQLAHELRHGETAVIGRLQENKYIIDPRTVVPEQVETLLQNLVHCFRKQ